MPGRAFNRSFSGFTPADVTQRTRGGIDKLVSNLIQIDQRKRQEAQNQERIDLQRQRQEEAAQLAQTQEVRSVEQHELNMEKMKAELKAAGDRETKLTASMVDSMFTPPQPTAAPLGKFTISTDGDGKKTSKLDLDLPSEISPGVQVENLPQERERMFTSAGLPVEFRDEIEKRQFANLRKELKIKREESTAVEVAKIYANRPRGAKGSKANSLFRSFGGSTHVSKDGGETWNEVLNINDFLDEDEGSGESSRTTTQIDSLLFKIITARGKIADRKRELNLVVPEGSNAKDDALAYWNTEMESIEAFEEGINKIESRLNEEPAQEQDILSLISPGDGVRQFSSRSSLPPGFVQDQ